VLSPGSRLAAGTRTGPLFVSAPGGDAD
jgi:hypothetical protein